MDYIDTECTGISVSFFAIQSGHSKIPVLSLNSHIVSEYSGILFLMDGSHDNS
jgi:hypothetical protein